MESPDEDAPLADWLALARDSAEQARTSEARSHAALYRAIGLSYDFALVTIARPDEYAELLENSGLKVQARAPMTAVVKLVFGSSYDKTRITEYRSEKHTSELQSLMRHSNAIFCLHKKTPYILIAYNKHIH